MKKCGKILEKLQTMYVFVGTFPGFLYIFPLKFCSRALIKSFLKLTVGPGMV